MIWYSCCRRDLMMLYLMRSFWRCHETPCTSCHLKTCRYVASSMWDVNWNTEQRMFICQSLSWLRHNSAVNVKVADAWYSTSSWGNPITEALRYGTRCQGITQFYLPPTHLSTNGMNQTCLCLSSQSMSSFTYLGGMEGCVVLCTTTMSLPSSATWWISQLLAVQTIMPHWQVGISS